MYLSMCLLLGGLLVLVSRRLNCCRDWGTGLRLPGVMKEDSGGLQKHWATIRRALPSTQPICPRCGMCLRRKRMELII